MARLWLLLALLIGAPAVAAEVPLGERACVKPPDDRLCADFPHDQTDFSAHFEYIVLVKGAQDPFDAFSWHATAQTADGRDGNFTFLLSDIEE